MEIKLNVTLKSATIWKKGLILNDEFAPFPDDILKELRLKTGAIKVLKKSSPIEPIETTTQKIVKDQEPNKKITKTDILKMNKESLVDYINDMAHLTPVAKQKLITHMGEESYLVLDMKRKELIDLAVRKLRL